MMHFRKQSLLNLIIALIFCTTSFTSTATDYFGPIANMWAESASYVNGNSIGTGQPIWVTPSSAPSTWIKMNKSFISVAAALQSTDYGSSSGEQVVIGTDLHNSTEKMDWLSIADTRFNIPANQVQTVQYLSTTSGVPLAVMWMGDFQGGVVPRLVDGGTIAVAASSVIGRRPANIVEGVIFVFNSYSGQFVPYEAVTTVEVIN